MKTLNSLASWIVRFERGLEALLFAATTGVVGGGVVAVFLRFGPDLA